MSFFGDLFGGASNAASAQSWSDLAGLTYGKNNINQGSADVTNLSNKAYQPFATNYGIASTGVNELMSLLGLNGQAGTDSAMTALQLTPGYQFAKSQGDGAIAAQGAASGNLNSGNTLTALSNYNQGLAGNTYQNAVGNLNPFMGLLSGSAAGGAGVLGNEAGLLNSNQLAKAGLVQNTASSIGNANASADLANQSMGQNLLSGLLGLGSSALGGAGGLSGITSSLSGFFGGGGSDIFGGDAAVGNLAMDFMGL